MDSNVLGVGQDAGDEPAVNGLEESTDLIGKVLTSDTQSLYSRLESLALL